MTAVKVQNSLHKKVKQKQDLGLLELIAIGVGGMIGGGIFSVLGIAVSASGNAAPLAFVIGSLIAMAAGYSFVKLAVTFKSDGSSFTYLEKAFPKVPAVAGIAGWVVVAGYIGTLALYAFTFGAYTSHLFGFSDSSTVRMIFSMGVLLLFLFINTIGSGIMGKIEDFAVYIKILLLVILAAVGMFAIDQERFVPFMELGAGSVFFGGALVFVAFEGFQLITNAVMETKDYKKNIPRGVYLSVIITSIIYILIAVVSVGSLDISEIIASKEYALAAVAKPIMGKIGVVMVDIAAMLATASAINATTFGSSHLAYEISNDNLAPKVFSFRNHARVPVAAGIIIIILSMILTAFGGLELIASFSSLTFLLVSVSVCVANFRMRNQTKAAMFPVISGIILISVTIIALIYYMGKNNPSELYFSLAAYGSISAFFFLFEYIHSFQRKQKNK